jgi:outer membrane protein assembly factor BamB
MRHFFLLLIATLAACTVSRLEAAPKRYLYMSSPDGAQSEARSGTGILIFDIDDGHRFVRRIEVPSFKEGLRGFTASAKNHRIYYSTTNRRLGCFDIETEKVVWERLYEAGCDRSSVSLDGRKIYVPTGWWYRGANSGFLVVNAEDGAVLKRIPVGLQAHNSITSLDGRFAFLGTETNLTMFRVGDDSVVRNFPGVGEAGVFPFTVDDRNRFAYVCLGKHVGFDVVNLETGEVPHRVLAGETPIAHRTHGAGLTPDEKELWISDQDGKKLFVFDATRMPPTPTGSINLSIGGHGWICFSLDGRYAWTHTPDIIDARTKKVIGTFRDETGSPVASSKFIEIQIDGGKVIVVGNEFGLGRAHAAAASK